MHWQRLQEHIANSKPRNIGDKFSLPNQVRPLVERNLSRIVGPPESSAKHRKYKLRSKSASLDRTNDE